LRIISEFYEGRFYSGNVPVNVGTGVIPRQLSQPVNSPSQIFLKFNKQIELLMLISSFQRTNFFG